jgi:hypothetical protein
MDMGSDDPSLILSLLICGLHERTSNRFSSREAIRSNMPRLFESTY